MSRGQVDFGSLDRILKGPRPPCAHEPCQDLADWAAVAPSTLIFACASHLGSLLEQADPRRGTVWFVHSFER